MKSVSTSKTTIVLMLVTLLGRMMGLFREMMLSYVYGASAMSDAYVVATTFSSVIFAGLAAAVLNGYVPIAVEANQKNELRNYTNNMMANTFLATYLFATVLVVLLHPILSIIARGFSQEAYNYAYQLSIYVLIFSPLLCLINVLAGYLQIKGNFLASALQSLATNIIMIFVFYITVGNVSALGMGYGFSVLVPFLLILLCSCKEGYVPWGPVKLRDNNTLQTWKLILPTLGVQLAAQINNIIDRSFASSLEEGTVSALKYAFLLCTMVVSIIAVSIGMVKFPRIAEAFNEKKEDDAMAIFTSSITSVLVVIIPIVFGAIFLAKPIIRLLFEHGAFLPSDTERTATLLQIYAFVILGNSFQEIISRILMAAKKAKALFGLYIGYVFLNIVFNMCFVRIWQANGLALGTTLSTMISVILMLSYLKTQYASLELGKLVKSLIKTVLSAGIMILVLLLVESVFRLDTSSSTSCLIYLIVSVFAGAIVYAGGLLLLKEDTIMNIRDAICNKDRSNDEDRHY